MAKMLEAESAKRAEVERLLMKRTNQEWRSLQKRIKELKRGELPRYLRRIYADGFQQGYEQCEEKFRRLAGEIPKGETA